MIIKRYNILTTAFCALACTINAAEVPQRSVNSSLLHLALPISLALVAGQQQTQWDISLEDRGLEGIEFPPLPSLPGGLFAIEDTEPLWNNPVSQISLAPVVLQQQNPLDERQGTKRKAPHANPNEQQRWKQATSGDRENPKEFKCTFFPKCPWSFDHRSNRNRHIKGQHEHEKRFFCSYPECSVGTLHAYELKLHVREVHDQEKEFKCSHSNCNYSAFTQSKINSHERTHTGEKPHPCDQCQETFSTLHSAKRHLKSHKHLLGKTVPAAQLSLVPTVLQQKNPLDERRGTKRKAADANAHEQKKQRWKRVTSGDEEKPRPFKCTLPGCSWDFSNRSNRNRHIKGQHKHERRFFCSYPECSVGTLHAYTLKQHMEKIHNQEKKI